MKPEDRVRVQHMLDAAQEACEFMGGVSFEDLKRSRLLTNAVVRSLEVLGEAAAQITPEFRESNGWIPWRDIIAMRNRLIHAYFDINYAVVWRTVKEDLPQFIKLLKQILEQ